MKIVLLSLFAMLVAVAQVCETLSSPNNLSLSSFYSQMNAELYDEVSGEEVDFDSNELDPEWSNGIVIMRFTTEQEPQLVEITNPVQKIIVGKVKREKFNFRSLQHFN